MGSLRSLMRREVEPVRPPIPSDEQLLEAIESGDIEQTEILLKQGANPNAEREWSGSALGMAATNGNLKLVQLLISHGANVNYCDQEGLTPLHWAAFRDLEETCEISRFLLDCGARPNATDPDGRTPLMLAVAYKENVDLVKLLLERGADATLTRRDGKRALDLFRKTKNKALRKLLEPVS